MSGSYPTTPVPKSITIAGISPALVSVTHSLRRQVRSRGGQRWKIEADYAPLTRAAFAPLFAFANAQRGQYETFTYVPPVYGSTSGTATGTLLVDNASGYAAGDITLDIDGLAGVLKAGDFVKFSGQDKVYMLASDSTTSITLTQPLVAAVVDDEAITYNDVPFTMAFRDDKQELSMGSSQLIGFSITLVEVI